KDIGALKGEKWAIGAGWVLAGGREQVGVEREIDLVGSADDTVQVKDRIAAVQADMVAKVVSQIGAELRQDDPIIAAVGANIALQGVDAAGGDHGGRAGHVGRLRAGDVD